MTPPQREAFHQPQPSSAFDQVVGRGLENGTGLAAVTDFDDDSVVHSVEVKKNASGTHVTYDVSDEFRGDDKKIFSGLRNYAIQAIGDPLAGDRDRRGISP